MISGSAIPPHAHDIRRPHEKQLAVHLILASTLFERIAFYTISANLVSSLGSGTSFHWSNKNSSIAMLIFSGISCVFTLIFAILTDAKSDRFKAIIIGLFIYIVGYIVAIVGTSPGICNDKTNLYNATDSRTIFDEQCARWILPALIIIGISAGAVQSNMPVFGVEQIEERQATSQYFNKHVIAVGIGAASSKLIIAYIQDKDETNLFIGYIVATLMLFISIILFIIRRRYYIHIIPYDSIVTKCIPVVKNAFQTWRQYKNNQCTIDEEPTSVDGLNISIGEESIRTEGRPSEFLDFAKVVNNGKFADWIVNDVKSLRRLLIVFSLLIPYWIIYDQVYTSFPLQRQHMKISTNITYKSILNTLISFGDPITLLIGLFIFNMFLYKYVEARNQSQTITIRFAIGMCFACLSMCISGIVEVFRQQECDDHTGRSNLSIFFQIPQNILMGLSKLFVLVASYEFAYFASRRSGRSFFMGLRYFAIGVSSFIDSLYIHIFPRTNINVNFICQKDQTWYWSFYTYFFILASVQLIFIIIFIVCQKKYHIIKLNPQLINETQ